MSTTELLDVFRVIKGVGVAYRISWGEADADSSVIDALSPSTFSHKEIDHEHSRGYKAWNHEPTGTIWFKAMTPETVEAPKVRYNPNFDDPLTVDNGFTLETEDIADPNQMEESKCVWTTYFYTGAYPQTECHEPTKHMRTLCDLACDIGIPETILYVALKDCTPVLRVSPIYLLDGPFRETESGDIVPTSQFCWLQVQGSNLCEMVEATLETVAYYEANNKRISDRDWR